MDIGVIKVKEYRNNSSSLKKLSKIELNQIYNKSYLSRVKIVEDKGRFFILDERTKAKVGTRQFKR
jgi:hypothetical protein